MKRLFNCLTVCVISMMLMSCGNQGTDVPNSAGYLPTRFEKISTGGVIPEGCESRTAIENSGYAMESLWGSWVLKGSNRGAVHNTDQVLILEVDTESGEKINLEVEYLPSSFSLHPSYVRDAWKFNNLTDLEVDQLGEAFENLGFGYGTVTFQEAEKGSEDVMMPVYVSSYGSCAAGFAISGNTLAIGLTDDYTSGFSPAISDVEETNIFEIDYEFSWTGYELILTYNGDSATYVPNHIENYSRWDLNEAGVINENEPIDGICGITVNEDSQRVLYDIHDGYVDSDMIFNEDGTADIEGITYIYRYSGDSLTLISQNDSAIYSNYTVQKQSIGDMADSSFYVGDKQLRYDGDRFQWILDNGFKTDLDLNQLVNPCQVTEEISLDYNGIKLIVKVCNPYEKVVPLKDCYICYILINDPTGVIRKENGFYGAAVIGQTTCEDIDLIFETPYEKTETYIKYKTRYPGGIMIPSWDSWVNEKQHDYGNAQLDLNEKLDVIYEFDNGVLKDVIIQEPALLYNGLQDNVSNDALADMDATTMIGIMEIRDDVLNQLKKAFDNAGISVDINEFTGEIVMDSMVLFDTDSSTLTADGQDYIDNLMSVYASVILDDSLEDIISEVRFEGHTDSSGSYNYNLNLSQERADAVLNYCLSSGATSMNRDQKERLKSIAYTVGYSYSDLVYDSSGMENAEASRRVAIKFYIDTKAKEISSDEYSISTSTSGLTADDFKLTKDGVVYDVFERVDNQHGSTWYFYFDSVQDVSREAVVETARGIHIGDSINSVFSAYGNTDVYKFDSENPFYNPDDATSAMLDECESFVMYWDEDENIIGFFFDNWNCVNWIVYYIA